MSKRTILYIMLAGLFLIASAYQGRFIQRRLQALTNPDTFVLKQPIRVYLDDRDGWVERTASGSERDLLESLNTELLLPLGAKEQLSGFKTLIVVRVL